MSLWLEQKYIKRISGRLKQFHPSGATFAFRCPFCGDSKTNEHKTRGYFFKSNPREYFYKCHNCNISMSFRTFLRKQHPDVFTEYQLETVRNERPTPVRPTPKPSEEPMFGLFKSKTPMPPTVASLPADHPIVAYCQGRQLPPAALKHLHFSDEWVSWVHKLNWNYTMTEDHAPRLILPWFDRRNQLIGAQSRRIDATGSAGRYVTIKDPAKTDKIYGWDRLNLYQTIHVVEGPIDSWFLPNACASMDSDLMRLHNLYFAQNDAVYIWDNEPRNVAVTANILRAIKAGLKVVVWPAHVKEKDLNDMAKAGRDVPALVAASTYRGLRAELEYRRWKLL